jgi:acyl-CoA reductase-like NAD-dependent aldehyde dehydrogenase
MRLKFAVENLVDGSYFNSGQSCCAIERIYVDTTIFTAVRRRLRRAARGSTGSAIRSRQEPTSGRWCAPTPPTPCARRSAGDAQRARRRCSKLKDKPGTPYLPPEVLVERDHGMEVMTEESFGPVVGIQAVKDDEEAIA